MTKARRMSARRNRILLATGLLVLAGCASAPGVSRARGGGYLDDARLVGTLFEGAVALLEGGKATDMDVLRRQLEGQDRPPFPRLSLPSADRRKRSPAELYEASKHGVLVVGVLCGCETCKGKRGPVASGFVLAADGVVVTNYHVVDQNNKLAMAVMTYEGQVFPVTAVLAADEANDIAILQVDAPPLEPLPLATGAPVGTSVTVISHPSKALYTLSEGIVSRRFLKHRDGRAVPKLAITADFGRGSSGAPVLNEFGAVVGMVEATHSIYCDKDEG
ncbi:MAG TPA: serine protease, partial [Candidatus Hydrogenedentes bacterium]|nr:serine protease [Candidatus Hydrogenedentota bacterium]